MITSFIDGRVRLRAPALKDPDQVAQIQTLLSSYAGVARVQSNLRTGSLLIEYDATQISREMLMFAASALESQLGPPATEERASSDLGYHGEALLLIAALTLCLGCAAAGAKSWHVWSGGVFTLLTANHVLQRRRTLSRPAAVEPTVTAG